MKPTTRRAIQYAIAIATLSLGLSGPGNAQQPTQAQASAIRSACSSDYRANCASVPAGGTASLACLQQNMAKLSPSCQKAVTAAGGASAAPAPAPATATTPPSTGTGTAPASGASTSAPPTTAPAATAPATTPPPKTAKPLPTAPAAPKAQAVPARPMSLREELAIVRQACGPDYRAYCAGVQPGGGRAVACLRAKAASLSPTCQQALMR